jgi:hypothetical protein
MDAAARPQASGGEIMTELSKPDPGEQTGEAKANYKRLELLAQKWNDGEIAFVNVLRKLYRNAKPLKYKPVGLQIIAEIAQEEGAKGWNGALVFNGGHVRVAGDEGYFYDAWKSDEDLAIGARTGRFTGSSHLSSKDQYEVRLKGAGCILVGFGEYPTIPGGAHTWFQSESHAAMGNTGQWLLHGGAFVDHKLHGNKQVGAFGYSEYSEKPPISNPLVVKKLPKTTREALAAYAEAVLD